MESIEKFTQEQVAPNTLKSEHLKEGVSPIIACIGTPEQFSKEPGDLPKDAFWDSDDPTSRQNSNRNIDYYGNPSELTRKNFKNAGPHTYVISPVDNSNKFSTGFKNCTGIIVTGLDQRTSKNISFLSHEDPRYFLRDQETMLNLKGDLKRQLLELKDRSIEKTIDAVIVGGNYFLDNDDELYREDYRRSIKLLSEVIQDVLGFDPVVITGPKTDSGSEEVFYDNEHRRLYIMRFKVAKDSTKSYAPSDIKNQEKKWLQEDSQRRH